MKLRLLALAAVTTTLFACGTPCSRIAGAEAAADDKGKACSSSSGAWSQAKVESCEQNLKECSETDQKWMDTYADCLSKLQVCAEGQGFSWGLQRVGCVESLLKLSGNCASKAL